MTWTQPVCDDCWPRLELGPPRHRIKPEYQDTETCCLCGRETRNGLYARLNPADVPFPRGGPR